MAGTAVIPLTNTAKNLKDKQEEKKSRNPNPKTVEETDEENKKEKNSKMLKRMNEKKDLLYKNQKFKKLGDADSKGFENPIGKPQLKERTLRKSGGRVNLRGGGICKKGMNPKARGRNS